MENKTPLVLLDIDDTIADFSKYLIKRLNEEYLEAEELAPFDSWELPAIAEFHLELWSRSGLYKSLPLIKKAKEFIDAIPRDQYKLGLITARPEEFREDTLSWLTKHNTKVDFVLFDKHKINKIKELNETYSIELFADDKAETIKTASEQLKFIKHLILIDMPHNSKVKLETVRRVKSLTKEIADQLLK